MLFRSDMPVLTLDLLKDYIFQVNLHQLPGPKPRGNAQKDLHLQRRHPLLRLRRRPRHGVHRAHRQPGEDVPLPLLRKGPPMLSDLISIRRDGKIVGH